MNWKVWPVVPNKFQMSKTMSPPSAPTNLSKVHKVEYFHNSFMVSNYKLLF